MVAVSERQQDEEPAEDSDTGGKQAAEEGVFGETPPRESLELD